MDRRERSPDLQQAMRIALDGRQAEIWTAMPGIIQSFDPVKRTCVVQPAIMGQVMLPDNSIEWVKITLLLDCPVQFPAGGGFTLTFPIAEGDECLVVFANRCIDAWWQNSGVQVQAELRMHSLSDGFVIPGVSSVPNVIPAISTTNVQLRSDDGNTYFQLDPAGNAKVKAAAGVIVEAVGDVDVTAGGEINAQATTVNVTGSAEINLNAPIININGQDYMDHTHSGIEPGGGTSGGVTP